PRRIRTANSLGGRYDLNYFKGATGFSRWRLGLCIAFLMTAFVWLGADWTAKKKTIYSAGPLSSAHSFFANRCEICHSSIIRGVRKVGMFWQTASDDACLLCHDAPAHQNNQI